MRHGIVRGWPEAGAFTLLELMIAVTILGVVMASVYATWSAALSGWKRSGTISAVFQRERVVMDTLTELASSLVYFKSDQDVYAVQGQHDQFAGDAVSFATASDVLLPQAESSVAGMRRVTIALQTDEQGSPFLSIMNTPVLAPSEGASANQAHMLSAEVRGFQVRYRHPVDQTWQDKWDDARLVPAAMEFTVAFGGTDSRTPPVIVTRAVDIPIVQFALATQGEQLNQQPTTNQIGQQPITLVPSPTE